MFFRGMQLKQIVNRERSGKILYLTILIKILKKRNGKQFEKRPYSRRHFLKLLVKTVYEIVNESLFGNKL